MRFIDKVDWTEELEKKLVELRLSGMSFGRIAETMKTLWPSVDFTYKMCVGKFDRLRNSGAYGLNAQSGTGRGYDTRPNSANIARQARPKPPKPVAKVAATRVAPPRQPPRAALPVAEAEQFDPFLPDTSGMPGKRFMDLRHGECQWEITRRGDASKFRFCAEPTEVGKCYCKYHHARSIFTAYYGSAENVEKRNAN